VRNSSRRKSRTLGEALVVDDDRVTLWILDKALKRLGYLVKTVTGAKAALKHIEHRVPEVILTDMLMPGMDGKTFCREIRKDSRTAGVPLIMISTEKNLKECLEGFRAGADDYITKPFSVREVKARLERLVGRNQRALSSNPLSGLPGNPSIELEVNRRMAENKPFAFAYIDIDDFKSYNDVYGYQAGDRVIKDLARVLVAASGSDSTKTFVGHVGGDDFVIISSAVRMRAVLKSVLCAFDEAAGDYYTAEHRRGGGLFTANRQYRKQFFPMMKLSCAVIDTAVRRIHHYGELVEIASELKHHLKSQVRRQGSLAQWNGRLDPLPFAMSPIKEPRPWQKQHPQIYQQPASLLIPA
jgi:DNA-binding response OmpR family regulator